MALSNPTKALVKTTYKALLKTAKRLDATVPAGSGVSSALLHLQAPAAPSFSKSVRLAFRRGTLQDPASTDVDAALSALRKANKMVVDLATALRTKETPVQFSIGQVFRHRQYGYRAVIIARDESCHASAPWVMATGSARLPRGTAQPFYTCLVDLRDRPGAQVSYVAEDNIEPVAPGDDAAVVHPLLAKHFASGMLLEGGS